MDKNINDNDRIIIGVREWAIETVLEKGLALDRWLQKGEVSIDGESVIEQAGKFEEYVLGGITKPNKFIEANGKLYFSDGKGIKVVED